MANCVISVVPASVMVASTQAMLLTTKRLKPRFWLPITSAARCAVLLASLGCHATRFRAGSKKASTLPPLEQTLAPAQAGEVLECDELWSFVARRKNKRWVWLVMCRRTRQIVAYALGDRSEATCRLLWQRIPLAYRQGWFYTDFWDSYQTVRPQEQHRPTGKGSGQTNHIERWNNTLRQRLARFVRKTLSFSKCDFMHDICLQLFLHDYNRQCLLRLR